MPLYFFSIRVRDRLLPDREGVDLPAGTDPVACATFLARKLRASLSIENNLAGCFVEVADAAGGHVAMVAVPELQDVVLS